MQRYPRYPMPIRPGFRAMRILAVVVLATLVASCSTKRVAPVEERAAVPSRTAPTAAVPGKPAPPPVKPGSESDWRPQTYSVKRGDTLIQIALDHGLDYRDIVAWNTIDNPNRIVPGQVLRLSPPGGTVESAAAPENAGGVVTAPLRSLPPGGEPRPGSVPAPTTATTPPAAAAAAPAPTRNTETYKSSPKALKEPYSAQAAREMARSDTLATAKTDAGSITPASPPASSSPATVATPPERPSAPPVPVAPGSGVTAASAGADDDDGIEWMWPAKGKVVASFSETANLKGLDIAGNAGQAIVASAPGRVVYAGSGLRGYGKLVIIKHNKTFLSAYAHNREILVKEGQQVARGQKIAEMGNTDADQVKLHFEIRRLGKPMDPVKYLPPA